jgi:hypothetical protein
VKFASAPFTVILGAVLFVASAAVAVPLPTLTTAPGLESAQWNLWSDAYLSFLDNGDLHGLLAGATKDDLRALVRQARFSLENSDNATERQHLADIRGLLERAVAGQLPEAKATRSTLETPRAIVALPFFPMHVNDTWFMKDANTSEDFTLSIVGTVPVNGVTAQKMKRSRANGAEEWDAMTNDAAKGIDLHVRFIRGTNAVLTPAVHFADATTDAGKVYTTIPSFPNPATGNKTVWTCTVVGVENVTVPAGTFTGCMKVNMLIKDQGLGTVLSKIDLWVAPKVGFVKRVGQFFGVFFVETATKIQVAP